MQAVIATTPAGMLAAQSTVKEWVVARMKDAQQQLVEANSVFNALHKAGLYTKSASSQIRRANMRIRFYEKVGAALDAGYYIIPPFDVQIFAIRTNKDAPLADRGERHWSKDKITEALPLAEGVYINPTIDRSEVDTVTRGDKEITIYENDSEWKDVELPVRALKPTIIEATAKAMQECIFDALGIAPSYRSADPIIVGQIRHWQANKAPLTFFVAWWLDETDI